MTVEAANASATEDGLGHSAKPRLLSLMLSYGGASYVSALLTAVRGVAIARILGPDSYGIWSVLTLVLVWSQFSDLGLASAVNRQIPMRRADGDAAGIVRAASIGLGLKCAATAIFGVAVGLVAYLSHDPVYREGLAVIAALVVVQGVQQLGASVLLASRRVREAARLVLTFAVLNLVAPVAGAAVAGLRGVWYGLALALGIAAVLYLRAVGVRPALRVSAGELRTLATAGVPIAVLSLISYNLVNVDQLVVAGTLGSRPLAFYTIGLTAGGLLMVAPNALASVLGPVLIERWRAGEEDMERIAWEPVRLLRDTFWIVVLAAMVLLPPAVEFVLPQYLPGVEAALVYLPGVYLLGINLGASNLLLALNKHWANIPLTVVTIAVSALLERIFVAVGLGLTGVALGSTIGYALYTFAHLGVIRVHLGDAPSDAFGHVFRMVLPALAWVALLLSRTLVPDVVWAWVTAGFSTFYGAAFTLPIVKRYLRLGGQR